MADSFIIQRASKKGCLERLESMLKDGETSLGQKQNDMYATIGIKGKRGERNTSNFLDFELNKYIINAYLFIDCSCSIKFREKII